MTARTLAAAALVAVIGTALAQPPRPEARPAGALQPKAQPKGEKPDLPGMLAARVTVEKFDGKFADAVKLFAEKYELPLVLTREAEQMTSIDGETPTAEQKVKLPRLANVRVGTALGLLCEQTHTRFLIHPDVIRIVPDFHGDTEAGIPAVVEMESVPGAEVTPLLPSGEILRNRPLIKRALVNASFKERPLSEVLDEIAESTGANVALSPLVPAEVRRAPVTVRFANTPVDAAVRTLCEMTETGVIEDANVLLVTTRERASVRAEEDAQKRRDRQPLPQFGLGGLGGFGGLGGVAVPDAYAAEIAKLKEQNDQLKKQLNEIQKQLKKLTEK